MKPGLYIAPAGTPLDGEGWQRIGDVADTGYGINEVAAEMEKHHAAAKAKQSFDDMAAALNALGHSINQAARDWGKTDYTKPAPPKPWAGNIATQKRRKRL